MLILCFNPKLADKICRNGWQWLISLSPSCKCNFRFWLFCLWVMFIFFVSCIKETLNWYCRKFCKWTCLHRILNKPVSCIEESFKINLYCRTSLLMNLSKQNPEYNSSLKFLLYRIPVYLEFCLDRFLCINSYVMADYIINFIYTHLLKLKKKIKVWTS
jgi:hypothetical protein